MYIHDLFQNILPDFFQKNLQQVNKGLLEQTNVQYRKTLELNQI